MGVMPESLEYDITKSDFHRAHYPKNLTFVRRRITLGNDTLEDILNKWYSYLKEDGLSLSGLSAKTGVSTSRLEGVFEGEIVPLPLEFLAICEGLSMLVSGIPLDVIKEGRKNDADPLRLEW